MQYLNGSFWKNPETFQVLAKMKSLLLNRENKKLIEQWCVFETNRVTNFRFLFLYGNLIHYKNFLSLTTMFSVIDGYQNWSFQRKFEDIIISFQTCFDCKEGEDYQTKRQNKLLNCSDSFCSNSFHWNCALKSQNCEIDFVDKVWVEIGNLLNYEFNYSI